MKEIKLADGSILDIKINFLTVKMLVDMDLEGLQKKAQSNPEDGKLQMEIASKLIYAIIRSNGRKVDLEEAMELIPLEEETISLILTEFTNKMKEFKNHQENKM